MKRNRTTITSFGTKSYSLDVFLYKVVLQGRAFVRNRLSANQIWDGIVLRGRVAVRNRTSVMSFGTKSYSGDAFWYEIVLQGRALVRNVESVNEVW